MRGHWTDIKIVVAKANLLLDSNEAGIRFASYSSAEENEFMLEEQRKFRVRGKTKAFEPDRMAPFILLIIYPNLHFFACLCFRSVSPWRLMTFYHDKRRSSGRCFIREERPVAKFRYEERRDKVGQFAFL